ncbi:MAG: hypothetical protein GEU94_08895 [Micromonosporaceae bacterium]|nr:hypothetical protein [Micromonosporaceae bacterium]
MRVLTKLGLFGLALAVVFTAALGAGRVVGPVSAGSAAGHGSSADGAGPAGREESAGAFPKGLLVSDRGYRFAPEATVLAPGSRAEFRFTILGAGGEPVTEYVPTHEKLLHLVVVRRDLTGFWHVHPTLGPDGVWSVPLTLPDAGGYRAFADFQPKGAAEPLTLGADLAAPGRFAPRELPAAATTSQADGYEVELRGDLVAGKASPVTLRVSKAGRPVTDLEPYLGAYGHLVALRAGDLAYLHVHPTQGAGAKPGPEVGFAVEVPSAGQYRLFLDFQHGGQVRTAAFTVNVAASPAREPGPERSDTGGHDGHAD